MTNKQEDLKAENKALKKQNKELERELTRKEKALAEVVALLTLKKKTRCTVWGGRGSLTTAEIKQSIISEIGAATAAGGEHE